MLKKLLPFVFVVLFHLTKAQNEFITIWEPGITTTPVMNVVAPSQASSNQIWFPGIGQNYTIFWEEVGYPQHNGTLTNVTSTGQILIDFGTPSEGNSLGAKYRVKVSNGNGVFHQIKFATYQTNGNTDVQVPILQMHGSADKLLEIEQWGNIAWSSMQGAFANCQRMQLTATDAPNLSNVIDASMMFYLTNNFSGAPSMQNWDTSNIENFSFMFDSRHVGITYYINPAAVFNPPGLSYWDVSSATDLSYMFAGKGALNQNLSSWNVANVKNMGWMFAFCSTFNQPLNSWNTQKLEKTHYMFFITDNFNQPLNNWDVSKVVNMNNMFSFAESFNQPLDSWDVGSLIKMDHIFDNATSFNQSLADWNLASLTTAIGALKGAALDCNNYSKTLAGWADNPNTPNNISLMSVIPAQYASNVTNKRDILINKGWSIIGDTVGNCFLATSELNPIKKGSIYPNPASDYIHLENIINAENYTIKDMAGRLIKQGSIKAETINISTLPKGNYILQIATKDKTQSFKFIKK